MRLLDNSKTKPELFLPIFIRMNEWFIKNHSFLNALLHKNSLMKDTTRQKRSPIYEENLSK